VVFVLDAEGAPEALAFEFGHRAFDIGDPSAPGHVVCAGALLGEVFEMEADDSALEFLEALDRVEAGANPMAGVGAGPEQRAAALDGLEDGVGIPVVGRLGMVMDGDFDVVVLAEFLDHIQGLRFGFRDQGVNAPLFGEVEDLAALGLVRGELDDADVDELDAGGRSPFENGLHVLVGEVNRSGLVLAVEVHTAGKAQVLQAEGGGLIDGLSNGEFLEGIGMNGELPAELVGRTLDEGFGHAEAIKAAEEDFHGLAGWLGGFLSQHGARRQDCATQR